MTMYDFIYRIGYGVALIILFFIFTDTNEKLPQEKRQGVLLIFGSAALFSLLSWAVPIVWLFYHYLIKKNGEVEND